MPLYNISIISGMHHFCLSHTVQYIQIVVLRILCNYQMFSRQYQLCLVKQTCKEPVASLSCAGIFPRRKWYIELEQNFRLLNNKDDFFKRSKRITFMVLYSRLKYRKKVLSKQVFVRYSSKSVLYISVISSPGFSTLKIRSARASLN